MEINKLGVYSIISLIVVVQAGATPAFLNLI
ncbi:Uncharacterised protein [Legionella pneumophila]|nr:Uncharacterised protein [Legionella pneumophila]